MRALNLPIGTGSPSRIPPRAQTSDESGMVDRRRWTSFLTWAFILSEMAARDGLLPTAAHAGEDDLGRTSHTGSDTAPIVNNLPNINVSTATEGPEPITYQHAATLPSYAPTQLSSELADAKTALGSDSLPHGLGAGGGGGGGADHADAASGDGALDATGAHLSLGEGDLFALGHGGQLLDLGLHLDLTDTVHGLLGGVADTLDSLLGDVGDSLFSTTGNLLSLVGIRGDDAGAHSYSNDVSMPGQLSFSDSEANAQPHELATPAGGYTTYGIALNFGSADMPFSGEAAVHADGLGASVLDNLVDHLPGSHFDTSSDASHLDQAVLRTASDILA